MKATQKGIERLQKEYKEFLKSSIEGIQTNQYPDKDKEFIKEYLEYFSPEGREEDTVREAGYLRGIQYAINLLSLNKHNE